MARVNVRVDCSPFGLGFPISLAGMEDMMISLVGIPLRAAFPIASLERECFWYHFKSFRMSCATER